MTKSAKSKSGAYYKKYRNVAPGTNVEIEPKKNEPFRLLYSRVSYIRRALKLDGIIASVNADYEKGKVSLLVKQNPYYKEPEPANPQVKTPPAANMPPHGIGRIEFHRRTIDEDAADFFRDAVLAILPMEDAPKAFEKAKQATELFRRHLGEQLKPLNA